MTHVIIRAKFSVGGAKIGANKTVNIYFDCVTIENVVVAQVCTNLCCLGNQLWARLQSKHIIQAQKYAIYAPRNWANI